MNSSPSTTSNLHRKMLDLLLHHAHDMQHVFRMTLPAARGYGYSTSTSSSSSSTTTSASTTPSSTDLVVYQQSGGCHQHQHHEQQPQQLLQLQFLSIVTLAALLEYAQDPDPPEIRELEQQERIDQLELENDSLFVAMEDTQWELERVQRNYLLMKQRFYYHVGVQNNNERTAQQQHHDQHDQQLLLNLGKRYSDLQLKYASLKSDSEDYQIMYQAQLLNRDEMVQQLLQERDGLLQSRNSQQQHMTKKLSKLQKQLDTYQMALASKDLKLFQLVEERDSLKQQVKEATAVTATGQVALLSNNHSRHSKTSSTASTTTTTTSTGGSSSSSEDDDNDDDTTTTIASPPNKWVQGLKNRIRPARRSQQKVQPIAKREMEHSKWDFVE
jgi:hypothetical protein